MKYILLLTFALSGNLLNAQERQSFKINDIIYVRESNLGNAHDFLKSRYFSFVEKMEDCNSYALSYNKSRETAAMWCYKYFNNKLKILEGDEGDLVLFIKKQLKAYKKKTDFTDDGWVESEYHYKKHDIIIRENDQVNKYELYVE